MTTPSGGPAFPSSMQDLYVEGMAARQGFAELGMSLLDYFAAKSLAGQMNGYEWSVKPEGFSPQVYEGVARESYRFAAAMLAEKSRREMNELKATCDDAGLPI